jgi:hypothetical protein
VHPDFIPNQKRAARYQSSPVNSYRNCIAPRGALREEVARAGFNEVSFAGRTFFLGDALFQAKSSPNVVGGCHDLGVRKAVAPAALGGGD